MSRRGNEDEYETWNSRSAFLSVLVAVRISPRGGRSGMRRSRSTIPIATIVLSPSIAVRRDKEMQANAGLIKLPVAVLNHGNTVKHTEYSFLANVFAWRGYLAISPQHDLPTDPPMVTKVGELYVGRLPQIQRGVANIHFAIHEMKKACPTPTMRR
jgi:hypothetical protein